jgi:hypothetical protein
MDKRGLTPTGSLPEVALGLARARSAEEEHRVAQRRGGPPREPSGDGCSWRPVAIGLGLFVLLGWALTLLNRLNG